MPRDAYTLRFGEQNKEFAEAHQLQSPDSDPETEEPAAVSPEDQETDVKALDAEIEETAKEEWDRQVAEEESAFELPDLEAEGEDFLPLESSDSDIKVEIVQDNKGEETSPLKLALEDPGAGVSVAPLARDIMENRSDIEALQQNEHQVMNETVPEYPVGSGGGVDYPGEGWSFGISISGATVTIYKGGIKWGQKGWAWSADPSTTQTISADGQYIPVSCTFGSIGAAVVSIGSPTTNEALITDDASTWRSFIAKFSYDGSTASVSLLGVCGQIVDLSGEFAAS